MTVFDPFADLTRLRQQIGRMIDEQQAPREESGRVWRPLVDLFEDQDALTLRLDLPGAERDSLQVQLTGEELVVSGHRRRTPPQQGGCVHQERSYDAFRRVFRLGAPLSHERVQANYRDGVLTVVLPRAEAAKPRIIPVSTEGEG